MTEVRSDVPERRPKALAVTVMIVGAVVALGGVILAIQLRDATLMTATQLHKDASGSGSLSLLPTYRLQYFWLGIAVAAVATGSIAFLGGALRLLIRRQ